MMLELPTRADLKRLMISMGALSTLAALGYRTANVAWGPRGSLIGPGIRLGHDEPELTREERLRRGGVDGTVSVLSPDVTQDQKSGAYYYMIRIGVPDEQITRVKDLKLISGMPVESFIQTGGRSVMSYLTRPTRDQVMNADIRSFF
jgi:multidrug efflux pump subunit AcrA (membrane-fusion protein)